MRAVFQHRVLFEVQPWHSQSSKWYVILSIDILWCPDRQRPSSLLTFFRVHRESRRNRTNEIRRSKRSCRRQAWEHRVTFSRCFDLLWCLDRRWTLSGVRCELHKQSHLTFFKSKSEILDGIGRSSRSPVLKALCVFFEVHPWPSQRSFCLSATYPQHWPSPMSWSALTLLEVRCDLLNQSRLSSKSIDNRKESGGTYQRNQAFRLTTGCGFFEMPWPLSIRTHHVILGVDVTWCLIGTDFVTRKMCLSNLQLIHSHLFSSTSCWAFPPAQHVEIQTCFAISASCLWNVLLTHGRMPVTTRRIGTISALTWDFIPFVKRFAILFVRWFPLSVFGCLRIWSQARTSALFD